MRKTNSNVVCRLVLYALVMLMSLVLQPIISHAETVTPGKSQFEAPCISDGKDYDGVLKAGESHYYEFRTPGENVECTLELKFHNTGTKKITSGWFSVFDGKSGDYVVDFSKLTDTEETFKINLEGGRRFWITLSNDNRDFMGDVYSGTYSFKVSFKGTGTYPADAGDRIDVAKKINQNKWYSDSIDYNKNDVYDYYKVDKVNGKLLKINIQNDSKYEVLFGVLNSQGKAPSGFYSRGGIVHAGEKIEVKGNLPDNDQYYVMITAGTTAANRNEIPTNVSYKLMYSYVDAEPEKTEQPAEQPTKQPEQSSENESVKAFVGRLYTVALGRAYDEKGLNDWTNKLVSGSMTGAEVAQGFFFSTEFTNKYLSDSDFVDTLYRTMFDREADEKGKADWMKALAEGMSREFVYRGFAEGAEFKNLCDSFGIKQGTVTLTQNRDKNQKLTAFVARNYTKALGRSAEEAGINDWTGRILAGEATPADVTAGFIFSAEFTSKNLSNEDFLKVVYQTYFDRDPDEAGYNNWLEQLNGGTSREVVVNQGFSNSQEFANLVASFGL